MILLILLGIIALLGVAVFVLFRDKMVDLTKWHSETHAIATAAAKELAEFKTYVETHIHLTKAPPTASPAASAAAAKK